MDSPEAVKNSGPSTSTSTSTSNAIATATPSSESPPVQESPFLRYVNNLSPIKPVKASHVAQGLIGLNSPPLVFTSPREAQLFKRPHCSQSPSVEISQSDNGSKSPIDGPNDFEKLRSQLPGKIITDAPKDFYSKNDEDVQHCSSSPCVDEYLADPADIDSMYSVNQDIKIAKDVVEVSLSDLTHSKESLSKFDDKYGSGYKMAKTLLLPEESEKIHQEKPTHVIETGKIGEKNDNEWPLECGKLESSMSADLAFEKQHCDDSFAESKGNELQDHGDSTAHLIPDLKDVKENEDSGEMGPTSEAGQKHRGMRRRCLQFEEATSNAFVSNRRSPIPAHISEDSILSTPSSESRDSKASCIALDLTSSKKKMVKQSEPITSLFPPKSSGYFPVNGSIPSGIGLHLNSIVNSMPLGRASTASMGMAEGYMGLQGTSVSCHKAENITRRLISSNMDGQSSVGTEDQRHEINTSIAESSPTSESLSSIEPVTSLFLTSVHDKRKVSSNDAGNIDEYNQSSPKKKKNTSSTTDDDGCKRCNCKKSKCLKLYCDCFAAGIYCAESCACQGCFNRPEYEDTVLETRQQIESRNPLAFAPKIVKLATDFPSNNAEDVNLMTPSSARHKRGCNCKRSMCLKKYCECYQANVGCSSGCRCEGCKNVYGRKEDYVAMQQALSKERVSSGVEKGSHSAFLVANSESSLLLPETNEMMGSDFYDWQLDCNNVELIDQSSPRSNSVTNVCELTPLSNPLSKSSASSFSSKIRDWTQNSQGQLSHGSSRPLPGSSLRWRSSPNTLMTGLGETKYLQCLESDSGLYDILEDETPEILKESSTPTRSVKTGSPNQKRVSPPQSHFRELGSSSSGALRSGRKFILKAVPVFPPLTPCTDSKGNGHENSGTNTSK